MASRFPNETFRVRVRSANAEHRSLVINLPIALGEPLKLTPQEKIGLRWGDEPLAIGTVESTSPDGFFATVTVQQPPPNERRNYFRWSTKLPARYGLPGIDGVLDWHETHTREISGGGFCIYLDQALEPNAPFEIEIHLDPKTKVRAAARVAMVRENPKPPPSHLVGAAFTKIADGDRSRIIRYVFQKQWATLSR